MQVMNTVNGKFQTECEVVIVTDKTLISDLGKRRIKPTFSKENGS